MERTRVAVYGTLKQNQCNHGLLSGQMYLGQCELDCITLYDTGPYPAARLVASEGVGVEVYDVAGDTFARLDELEGFNAVSPESGLYKRTQLETPFGLAWVYIYNHDVTGCREIRSGDWLPCRN